MERLESESRIEAGEESGGSSPALGVPLEMIEVNADTKMLISRCLDGTEPYGRPLKDWETDKLSPKAIQAVLMRASGFKANEVARLLDTDDSWVSTICNHPYGKKIIHAMLHTQGSRVLDIKTRLEQHASDIMDRMVQLAKMEVDLNAVSKVGFGLLDRAGYGPKQTIEHESKSGKSLGTDMPTLSRLTAALEESQTVNRVTKSFVQKPPPADAPSIGTQTAEDRFAEAERSMAVVPRTGT